MCGNYIHYCVSSLSVLLVAAIAGAEEPHFAAPDYERPAPRARQVAEPAWRAAAPAERRTALSPTGSAAPWRRYSSGPDLYSQTLPDRTGDLASTPLSPGGSPLAYATSRNETASRVEDLMRDAGALRAQGNFAKAMELYNQAVALAPRYAEAYRQRALALARLGDRVRAQVDYNRFVALDPQASQRVRDEVALLDQSGREQPSRVEAAAYRYGVRGERPEGASSLRELAEARLLWAQGAFEAGRYDTALQWAASSDRDLPQARTRALMAQILFAQGDFRGAAAQARAAVAMGPAVDWRAIYGDYGTALPWFSRQFDALKEFVRLNPSSADARFLLGYQYLILGRTGPAHAELAVAAVIQPDDVVAKDLLARDGVEIVSSRRPLAQAETTRGDVGVAGRESEPPGGAVSPPPIPPPVRQAQRPTDRR